jgi:hypothetical protein
LSCTSQCNDSNSRTIDACFLRHMRPLALLTALACSGCSFAFMRPVPDDHARQVWVECTSSRLAPVVDGVGAGYAVLGALSIQVFETHGATGHGDGEVSASGRAVQVAALGIAAVYVASAVHGLGSARECESAHNASYARQLEAADRAAAPAAAPPLSPPPAPAPPPSPPPAPPGP